VGDGDGGLVRAASSSDAVVVGVEVAAGATRRRWGGFDQGDASQRVPWRVPAGQLDRIHRRRRLGGPFLSRRAIESGETLRWSSCGTIDFESSADNSIGVPRWSRRASAPG
jgi:hypothetical protein